MGRLIHPAAIKARHSSARKDFGSATAQIQKALEAEPANPDLSCELALSHVYKANESKAFELLPITSRGMRFRDLTTLLANHYLSRISLDPNDHDAKDRLSLMECFDPVASPNIGVKLTACLIVNNEEKVLARCLQSLQGIVDEIVVVDTGSTDSSKKIAQSFGATLKDFPWVDDFSAARNFALSFATGSWILWIDADEELVPESLGAIQAAIVRPQFGGYDIEIINYLESRKDGDQFRHCPTRLFRNLPGINFSGRIHEQINPSLRELGLPWARLEGAVILHHGYQPEVMDEKAKLSRTVTLLEREIQEDPSNAFQWFNLANAYLVAKRFEDAAHAGRYSVKLLSPGSGFGVNAFSILMQALAALGRFEEACLVSEEAKSAGYASLQISFETCNVLLSSGLFERAALEADDMLNYPWVEGSSGDIGIFTHKKYLVYAQIAMARGNFEGALEMVEVAIRAVPHYGPGQFVYGQVLEGLKKYDLARNCYEAAVQDPLCKAQAMFGIHRTYLLEGNHEKAIAFARLTWESHPAATDLWILWKKTVESQGNPGDVLECYKAFAQFHNATSEFLVEWGRCAAGFGDHTQALNCFVEAIRAEPSNANAYFNCADLLGRIGSYTEAVQIYQAGLLLRPEYCEGWFMLGNCLAKADRSEEAKDAFQKALVSDPSHYGASHNLARLCA